MSETSNKNDTVAKKQRLRCRPLWQRVIYPAVGVVLVIFGIIFWLVPVVPGFPLIIIGLPLLFCFHPRVELLFRQHLKRLGRFLMKKLRKKYNEG
jgi:uncharacterized membrane protein YbaN (DUF454 family)